MALIEESLLGPEAAGRHHKLWPHWGEGGRLAVAFGRLLLWPLLWQVVIERGRGGLLSSWDSMANPPNKNMGLIRHTAQLPPYVCPTAGFPTQQDSVDWRSPSLSCSRTPLRIRIPIAFPVRYANEKQQRGGDEGDEESAERFSTNAMS